MRAGQHSRMLDELVGQRARGDERGCTLMTLTAADSGVQNQNPKFCDSELPPELRGGLRPLIGLNVTRRDLAIIHWHWCSCLPLVANSQHQPISATSMWCMLFGSNQGLINRR